MSADRTEAASAGPAPAGPPRQGPVRAAVKRLLAAHASPAGLGWAVAAGVFLGCTPLYGLQIALCLLVAWLFRLNKVATLVGVQISTPPLTAVILYAEVQLGEYLLRGRFLGFAFDAFRGLEAVAIARSVLGAWVLGSVVVGAVLGAGFGLLTWAVARRRHLELLAPEVRAARPRAAARYAAASPRDRHYARLKYRLDPAYLLAADALRSIATRPEATVGDLGCGRGLLAVLLVEAGAEAQVVGLDWDEAGLATARAAARDLPRVRFEHADLTSDAPPACTGAALVDVLHYHPPDVQDAILARVAAALAPGGRLVVREADADERMLLARLFESWGARLGWHRVAGRFHYRPAAALQGLLEAAGFTVTIKPAGGFLHRANVLLVADRPAAATRVPQA
ncbi:MAG: DUF2062 domain-containing protein [Deltaproteobacteria bacterium]|nr:DUF2062 domain-containing protein [Deltaproteobacteria bacterium]